MKCNVSMLKAEIVPGAPLKRGQSEISSLDSTGASCSQFEDSKVVVALGPGAFRLPSVTHVDSAGRLGVRRGVPTGCAVRLPHPRPGKTRFEPWL